MSEPRYPHDFFARQDEAPDAEFYALPRFVTHIDDATIAALTDVYCELLAPGAELLDLMSSWVSHLPDVSYRRVVGLGLNAEELAGNARLDQWCVHDLNREPELPFADASFDAILNAVSIHDLTRPVEVFASMRRVLRPGGIALVATSHRLFPSKAIRAWQLLPAPDRLALIASYFDDAEGYGKPVLLDRSPPGADPLWVVHARRRESAVAPPLIG